MSIYNFYIVTGLSGSGKTTFCKNKNTLSIDDIINYSKLIINYNKIIEWINKTKNKNTDFYLDGYVFSIDPDLHKLYDILNKLGQFKVNFIFIYANNINMYRNAYKGKLNLGPSFKELVNYSDKNLADHIKTSTLNIITCTNNLNIDTTYLCRNTDGTLKISTIDELTQFLTNL
ncbi:putative helicase [Fadolivirus algeromassiliense]|jgi:RNase adaptor protein for sRNA GlmZ degradation|uniref:Helicase n=1 Tax=Fadolivirus FV1/VV64 TaxID=3070911 RepID=A0A7D3V7M1_9VIRU|nr:putative helicase [Fadolivirus algeromassiliense]QKF94156.1 putative helicase [Fadolivirus FV1/VV64]